MGFCQAAISEWSPSEREGDQTGRQEQMLIYESDGECFEEQFAKQRRGQRMRGRGNSE